MDTSTFFCADLFTQDGGVRPLLRSDIGGANERVRAVISRRRRIIGRGE